MATGENERNQDTVADLSREVKPDSITLADGKEYRLAPLDLNMLCEIEDITGQTLERSIRNKQLHMLRAILYVRLKKNNSEMTLEKTGELVSPGMMSKLTDLLKVV